MKIFKTFLISFFLLSCVYPLTASAALLSPDMQKSQLEQDKSFHATSGFAEAGETTVPDTIATIIKTVLGVLGVIFVILIVIAGFKWMMAGGNEKDIDEAKDKIKNAIIGLIIVLSAYAITAFVFNNLPSTSGGTGKSGPQGNVK